MDLEFPQLSATRPKASSLEMGHAIPASPLHLHTRMPTLRCSSCCTSGKHEGHVGLGSEGPELRLHSTPALPMWVGWFTELGEKYQPLSWMEDNKMGKSGYQSPLWTCKSVIYLMLPFPAKTSVSLSPTGMQMYRNLYYYYLKFA